MSDPLFPREDRGAVLSGAYRYLLWRDLSAGRGTGNGTVLWVMLNPSVADASQDDPTMHRVTGYSQAWGYDRLEVVNLCALRSPDPVALVHAGHQALGPGNVAAIRTALPNAALVVAAWGAFVTKLDPLVIRPALDLVLAHRHLMAIGVTKDGHPLHPLLKDPNLRPAPWTAPHRDPYP